MPSDANVPDHLTVRLAVAVWVNPPVAGLPLPSVAVNVRAKVPWLTFIAVLKVTVVATEPVPRLTVPGETVQEEFGGAPLQLRFTFPVSAPTGVNLIWNTPWCPEGMVWEAGDALMLKSATDSVTVTAADVLAPKFVSPL